MSCGKRPVKKCWDHTKNIQVVKPSRYQQNEASVKRHWKNVIHELELSYKDDKFWETSAGQVRDLVGPILYKRLSKIFNLPSDQAPYEPQSEMGSLAASEDLYRLKAQSHIDPKVSLRSAVSPIGEEEELDEANEVAEDEEQYSESSSEDNKRQSRLSRSKSMLRSKSVVSMSKSFSMRLPSRSFKSLVTVSKYTNKMSSHSKATSTFGESSASTEDDLRVHTDGDKNVGIRRAKKKNPHFTMLYCNESETDMIKWPSKYKTKVYEISKSDELGKKAELMTQKIAGEFYEWWLGLGVLEFKSEIRSPKDIEELFQVWFDEHASRGVVLDHQKMLPCVLKTIADYVGIPKASCASVLKRQIGFDIHAETSPAHTMAFNTCLPQKMKHIPPNNNTKKLWQSVVIPEDLRTLACVWDDIQHLTSTKAFHKWLQARPFLPMPACLGDQGAPGQGKQQPFVVPSDFVFRGRSSSTSSDYELNLPVSQFTLELKEVLSRLMNQN